MKKLKNILDEVLSEAVYIDIEHAMKDIKNYNMMIRQTDKSDIDDFENTLDYDDDAGYYDATNKEFETLIQDILQNLGFKPTPKNIKAASEHLQASSEWPEIIEDDDVVKELYPLMEAIMDTSMFTYKMADSFTPSELKQLKASKKISDEVYNGAIEIQRSWKQSHPTMKIGH